MFFCIEAAYNKKMKWYAFLVLLFTIFLAACQSEPDKNLPTVAAAAAINSSIPSVPLENTILLSTQMPTTIPTASSLPASATPTYTPTATATTTPTDTVEPTATVYPTATVVPTATYWPTVTRQVLSTEQAAGLVPCSDRQLTADLLTIATQQFSLPDSFVPSDLQPLSDYFPDDVLLGKDHYARAIIIGPLQQIIEDMNAAGLKPSILSAYRSYNEQVLAWRWWNSQYPGRVAIMSARPGNSEHQLGDTVDFGSPEINHLFHVDFANTAEGLWLADNAHHYGFTLSYPSDSYDATGFKYEPWHYRYVGVELATQLYHSGQILTDWQLNNLPLPCIP